jgi:microsomal dipeptidase-like Zn-dependent dipeptidase
LDTSVRRRLEVSVFTPSVLWAVSCGQRAGELARFGEVQNPKAIERIEETPNLTAALERRRWPAARIEKVMGRNWVAYLERVWCE